MHVLFFSNDNKRTACGEYLRYTGSHVGSYLEGKHFVICKVTRFQIDLLKPGDDRR